jgi:predicted  nucleic acid-binding Zn-ribbon protein
MNEHDHSSRLIWGIAVVALAFFGSVGLVWSTGGPLPTKAKAEVTHAAPKPKADTAGTANAEAIRKTVDALQIDLGNLNTRIDQLSQQVASIKPQDLSPIRTKVDALGTKVGGIETQVSSIASSIPKDLQGRLDALSAQIASSNQQASAQQASSRQESSQQEAAPPKHSSQKSSHHSRSRDRD